MISKRILSVALTGFLFLGSVLPPGGTSVFAQTAPKTTENPLDKLLAPIALYPDPLLAQVLACATSPDQVTEVHKWLQENKSLQGTKLQEAATAKGFDASFTAIVLFPDVLDTMVKNMPWTTELGKAFLSDQQSVLDSVQRLRKQAQSVGNLKTTEQQQVKVEKQDGTEVIVIQPANPQVVYVPVYNTTTVYTQAPPKEEKDSGDKAAAAAIIGFAAGIAIGAAMSDDYYGAPYGWGAWGVGWHSHTVIVTGGAWRVPPGARYPYTRPVPRASYRAPTNINAPTYNINVDRSKTINADGGNRPGNSPTQRPSQGTARPSTQPATPATRPATADTRPAQGAGTARPSTQPATPATRPATAETRPAQGTGTARPSTQPATPATKPATADARPDRPTTSAPKATQLGGSGAGAGAGSSGAAVSQSRTGTRSGALSGYQSGSSERAAQTRGQRSVSSGGARSRSR